MRQIIGWTLLIGSTGATIVLALTAAANRRLIRYLETLIGELGEVADVFARTRHDPPPRRRHLKATADRVRPRGGIAAAVAISTMVTGAAIEETRAEPAEATELVGSDFCPVAPVP